MDKVFIEDSNRESWLVSGTLPETCWSFDSLWALKPDSPGKYKIFGKTGDVPRFQQNYLLDYKFAGFTHAAEPLPVQLEVYMNFANSLLESMGVGLTFNQALTNHYESGSHYIGAHSDAEEELVEGSPIFSASWGQDRIFRIRRKSDKVILKDIVVSDNSFLVMCGNFQKDYTHEIVKTLRKVGPRINFTCRVFK